MEVTYKRRWDKKTFQNALKSIQASTPDKDFKFHSYGAFQSWKAQDTNFLEVATTLLDPENGDTLVETYLSCVLGLKLEWQQFCVSNNLAKFDKLAVRWSDREVSKVNNWLVKHGFNSVEPCS